MAPYTKRQNSTAPRRQWTVENGEGVIVAHVETEFMADVILAALLNVNEFKGFAGYQPGVPLQPTRLRNRFGIDPTLEHARVCWSAQDVLGKAREMGIELTDEEAEDFLLDNARYIREDMVLRGWDSIKTLLGELR
jgi:hypothetical protein